MPPARRPILVFITNACDEILSPSSSLSQDQRTALSDLRPNAPHPESAVEMFVALTDWLKNHLSPPNQWPTKPCPIANSLALLEARAAHACAPDLDAAVRQQRLSSFLEAGWSYHLRYLLVLSDPMAAPPEDPRPQPNEAAHGGDTIKTWEAAFALYQCIACQASDKSCDFLLSDKGACTSCVKQKRRGGCIIAIGDCLLGSKGFYAYLRSRFPELPKATQSADNERRARATAASTSFVGVDHPEDVQRARSDVEDMIAQISGGYAKLAEDIAFSKSAIGTVTQDMPQLKRAVVANTASIWAPGHRWSSVLATDAVELLQNATSSNGGDFQSSDIAPPPAASGESSG